MRRYKAKRVKTRCYQDGVGQLEPRFQGEGVVPGEYFSFCKTRHILLSNSANCTVLRAVVLTQYRRVTDGRTDRQTDGIAVASIALAMPALRRAVKNDCWKSRGHVPQCPTAATPMHDVGPCTSAVYPCFAISNEAHIQRSVQHC